MEELCAPYSLVYYIFQIALLVSVPVLKTNSNIYSTSIYFLPFYFKNICDFMNGLTAYDKLIKDYNINE